jgi:AsmA protein
MIRVLKVLGAVVLLLGLAAGALALFAPVERLRAPIETAMRAATGRSFHIHGPVRLTFAGGLELDLGAVTLADAPGAASATMMTASNATLGVEFLALLSGEVRPTALTLEGAEIRLTRDAAGVANWMFGGDVDPLDAFDFGDVRLINSRIVITAAGEDRELNFVDTRLRWPAGAATLSVAGTVAFRSERFDLDGLIEEPHALFRGGHVPLRLAFSSSLAEGSLDGDADLAADSFAGGITLSAPSARRLAAFFGALIPGERGFGEMSLAAAIVATRGEAHLRDIKFTLDDITGGGDLGIKLAQARLAFAGKLAADNFDLAGYMTALPVAEGAGWSDAPLDLTGLRDIDINLGLRLRSAVLGGLKVADLTGTLALSGGRLSLDVATATLYAGMGRGRLTLDATSFAPAWTLALSITEFDAQGLFTDALATGALTGRGSLTLDLSAGGATRRAVVSSLNGKLQLALAGGTLDSVDLFAIARTIGDPATLDGTTPDNATNIVALDAAFTVRDGMATLVAATLTGSSQSLSARGTIGLAARALRVRLAPSDVGGLPYSVTGPWAAPTFLVDWPVLKAMAASDAAALDGVPEARRPWLRVRLAMDAPLPEPPLVAGVNEP